MRTLVEKWREEALQLRQKALTALCATDIAVLQSAADRAERDANELEAEIENERAEAMFYDRG